MVLSEQEMREKMRQGGSTAPGLAQPQANPGGGALPPQAGQPPMPPPQQSALPAPPSGQPNGATPASSGKPSGGAGNPTDMLLKGDPEAIIKDAETSAGLASKKNDDPQFAQQKQQINEAMASQGMDPTQAYEEMKGQYMDALEQRHKAGEIDKKTHTKLKDRWKNIFNVVPKEDMGLFLMDFGLRLAAHSADTSFGGAFGQAGLGALGGVEQRKATEQKAALDRDELAHKRALDGVKLQQKDRELDIYEKRAVGSGGGPKTEATDQGLMYYNTETKQWEPIKGPDGKVVKQDYASSQGYRGEKAWLYDYGKRLGKSEEEIWATVNGAMGDQERRDRYEELILGMVKGADYGDVDPITGKRFRDFNKEDIGSWINHMVGSRKSADPSAPLPEPTPPPPAPALPEPEPEEKPGLFRRFLGDDD